MLHSIPVLNPCSSIWRLMFRFIIMSRTGSLSAIWRATRLGLGFELVGRVGLGSPAPLVGGAAVDRFPGEQVVLGLARPHQPDLVLESLYGDVAADGEADLGVLGNHPQVAECGQMGAAGQAVAVDLGDDRLLAVENTVVELAGEELVLGEPGVVLLDIDVHAARRVAHVGVVDGRPVVVGVRIVGLGLAGGEVVAGAEGRPGAFDDDDPDVVIHLHLVDSHGEFDSPGVAHGIPLLGGVENEPADRRILLVDDLLEVVCRDALLVSVIRNAKFLLSHRGLLGSRARTPRKRRLVDQSIGFP